MRRDEEHSSYAVIYRDGTHAERSVGLALAAAPEYRRFRALARATARLTTRLSWW
jgi:DNA gyrase subunit B